MHISIYENHIDGFQHIEKDVQDKRPDRRIRASLHQFQGELVIWMTLEQARELRAVLLEAWPELQSEPVLGKPAADADEAADRYADAHAGEMTPATVNMFELAKQICYGHLPASH